MRIAFCTFEKFDNREFDSIGSTRIRARWLMNHWSKAEEYVMGEEYDVMIFQKVYWESFKNNADYKGIKIMDLCDPDWLEGKPVFEYIKWADATVTSSKALADYIKKIVTDKPVIYIPDRVDFKAYPRLKDKYEGELKSLVWYGYHTNFHYVERTLDILAQKDIELTVISDQPMAIPTGYTGVKINNLKYNQETVTNEIAKHDAALLPRPQDEDYRGRFKSNNKETQAWALGIPVVAEPKDLDRLKKADDRKKEAEEKYKLVREKYDVRLSVKEYKELIKGLEEGLT